MQLGLFEGASQYLFVRALDFVAGYPAIEGKLTLNSDEFVKDKDGNSKLWLGRVRCVGYAAAHALSAPVSPVIALIRIVAMPIFFAARIMAQHPKNRLDATKFFFVEWLKEFVGVITAPVLNIAGVARASLGIISPKLYLKALHFNKLSEAQLNYLAPDRYSYY